MRQKINNQLQEFYLIQLVKINDFIKNYFFNQEYLKIKKYFFQDNKFINLKL